MDVKDVWRCRRDSGLTLEESEESSDAEDEWAMHIGQPRAKKRKVDPVASFSMSILVLDYYCDERTEESILRVFGRNEEGKSVCLHVHNYLPYFFIQAPSRWSSKTSFLGDLEEVIKGEELFRRVFRSVSYCHAMDAYGYKTEMSCFVKIELKNPTRLAQLGKFLFDGNNSLGQSFQPFEIHLPYIFQFLSDHCLVGMGHIHLKHVTEINLHCSSVFEVAARASDILVSTSINDDTESWSLEIPSLTKWQRESLSIQLQDDQCERVGPTPPDFSNSYTNSRSGFSTCHDSRYRDHFVAWLDSNVSTQEAVDILHELPHSKACAPQVSHSIQNNSDSEGDSDFDLDISQGELLQDSQHVSQINILDESDIMSNNIVDSDDMYYMEHSLPQYEPSITEEDYYNGWISPREPAPSRSAVKSECIRESIETSDTAFHGYVSRKDKGSRMVVNRPAIPIFRIAIVEVMASCSAGLLSDPSRDPVMCVVASMYQDTEEVGETEYIVNLSSEEEILEGFLEFIVSADPDAIGGWEIQNNGLGYLLKRAEILKMEDYVQRLSRVPRWGKADHRHMNDEFGKKGHSDIWISGRVILNFWRFVRGQIDLSSYSIENVAHELFSISVPTISSSDLLMFFNHLQQQSVVLDYLNNRVALLHRIILHLDIITKAAEYTMLLGVDFFSAITRGSQFQVEGVMVQVGKPVNYVFPSPNKEQVKSQPGLEYIATNLEPKSELHCDPVAVFDFRSLYPSLIVSHNLCYSTFIGKIGAYGGFSYEAGVFKNNPVDRAEKYVSLQILKKLFENDELFICDNGCVYVKSSTKIGILPLMCRNILETRFSVKRALKIACKNDWHAWKRVLDARQYALKMLANVTYGYTSASMNGRMPMSGLADSIVLLGRQVLAKVIEQAKTIPREVLYGDTDSMFVKMKNCSLKGAFVLAQEIADTASDMLPYPMKLQMEKIYLPSILVTKKRYCGMRYDRFDGKPMLESKGLENIRRDSCPIMQQIINDMLLVLFNTKNLTKVKSMYLEYISKIEQGAFGVDKFIFSSKVKAIDKYRNLPPAAEIARRNREMDPMNEVLYKKRVQYVVERSSDLKQTLRELVRSPKSNSKINYDYYIIKKINKPLQRIFGLIKEIQLINKHRIHLEINKWYQERKRYIVPTCRIPGRIDTYFSSSNCEACGQKPTSKGGYCAACEGNDRRREVFLTVKERIREEKRIQIERTCKGCAQAFLQSHSDFSTKCVNTFCNVYFAKDW